MSDQGAPEAQLEPQGIHVEPQFVIQALQNKVAELTNNLTMMEAYANQQQAVIQQLAQQVNDLQEQVASRPIHNGRTTKKVAKT